MNTRAHLDAIRALRAHPELANTVLLLVAEPPTRVTTPSEALALFRPLLAGRETEALAVAALDRRLRVIDCAILTTGSDTWTVVDPRQVLRWALTRARPAHAIILAHNHPSGDPEPSAEDRAVTRRVADAARAVGLVFQDHLVVTDAGEYVSLAIRGEVA